jgi:CysZ protein
MIFSDFAKAITQLGDPRFTRVLGIGVALTIALLVACYAGLLALVQTVTPSTVTLPVIGEVTWIGDLLGWGSLFLMMFFSMFLMVPVASAITSLFLDDVAEAVEDVYYPALPPVPRVSFAEGLRDTLAFLALLIVANLVALVVYVWVPVSIPFLFYGLNGFLLGREYFQIAAMRREGRAGARALRNKHRGEIWVAGCLMAVPLSVPLVNLLIPILGAATFTHLYHRLAAADRRL